MRIARHVTPALVLVLLPTVRVADRASDDPPSRVGRLSYLAGSVSFRPGSVEDWAAATINYPLTTGDRVWTDAGARAEVTIGSSAIRLGSQSAFGFLALDDRTTQVRLGQGSVEVRVRSLDADDVFEIDTPTGAVSLLRPGSYRLDVDSTGDTTTVTVRHGEAEVTAAGSAFAVRPGQAAVVSGVNAPSYDIHDALPLDNWEEWCTRRDRRWDDSRSARYVSRDMVGYEDLDVNGEWRTTDAYGAVWVPRTVVAGWAPYRYGHWAWVDPWGWTWIDDAPWGFAPFHYGRWVYVDGGWGWVPGRVMAERPVYAPALVAFVGGSHWSVSLTIGGGGVAWFPLAPEEPYVPAYHVSNNYVRNVNVTNVTNVTTITNVTNVNNVTNNVTNVNVTTINYKNREVPGAVTGVSHDDFVAAKPVGQTAVVVSREQLVSATVVGTAPTVVPTRQSVLAESGEKKVGRPPVAVAERSVVARATPPPPPVPFAARETALKEHPGRPVDDATLATLRERAPAAQPKLLVRPATPVTQAGATPAPALKPAREGLPAPQRLPATGFAPRREATPAPGAEPRGGRAVPSPAPAPPNAAANPPTGAGPGGKPDAAKPGRPGAGNTPLAEAERGHPGERPQPGARGQPSAERPQPAAQAQPPDRAQPARPQPGERPQAGARPQPGERPQPAAQAQPADRAQPSGRPQPGERPQPAARGQPPAERPQPAAQPQPAERPQPGARPQPGGRPQPTAQAQPAERPQPAARGQPPAERPQPAAQAQPTERPQPAARAKPAERPLPAAQPQPSGRPQPPAAQPQPAGRPAPPQPQQPPAQPQPVGRPAPTQPQQPAARPQAPPPERQAPKAQKADTAKEKAKPKPD